MALHVVSSCPLIASYVVSGQPDRHLPFTSTVGTFDFHKHQNEAKELETVTQAELCDLYNRFLLTER